MDGIWQFAGLVVVAVVGPYIMLRATAKQVRETKAEEKLEREAVAIQVAEAARLLKEQEIRLDESTKTTGKKLDAIHTLVDGAMTAAMQSELDMARSNLVLLEAAAHSNGGTEFDQGAAQEAIDAMEEKVATLTKALDVRKIQMARANEQKPGAGNGA
jgi:hypothetical protein